MDRCSKPEHASSIRWPTGPGSFDVNWKPVFQNCWFLRRNCHVIGRSDLHSLRVVLSHGCQEEVSRLDLADRNGHHLVFESGKGPDSVFVFFYWEWHQQRRRLLDEWIRNNDSLRAHYHFSSRYRGRRAIGWHYLCGYIRRRKHMERHLDGDRYILKLHLGKRDHQRRNRHFPGRARHFLLCRVRSFHDRQLLVHGYRRWDPFHLDRNPGGAWRLVQ